MTDGRVHKPVLFFIFMDSFRHSTVRGWSPLCNEREREKKLLLAGFDLRLANTQWAALCLLGRVHTALTVCSGALGRRTISWQSAAVRSTLPLCGIPSVCLFHLAWGHQSKDDDGASREPLETQIRWILSSRPGKRKRGTSNNERFSTRGGQQRASPAYSWLPGW